MRGRGWGENLSLARFSQPPLADLHESFQRMPQPLLTNSKGPPVANIHNFLARSNKKFL
jgi:hypothetical protein